MTEMEQELLRMSYTNNKKLIEIEDEIRTSIEKRDDLAYYFNVRDPKVTWGFTAFNLILASSLGTIILKWGLDLNKQAFEILFFGSLLFVSTFCGVEYLFEKNTTNELKKNIEEKYKENTFDISELIRINTKINKLNQIKNEITSEEKIINNQLLGSKVKK